MRTISMDLEEYEEDKMKSWSDGYKTAFFAAK